MRHRRLLTSIMLGATFIAPMLVSPASAQTPGVDVAVPRVVIVTAGTVLMFMPPSQVIETGDYVSWKFTGTIQMHTTTSGDVCGATTGLWNSPISSASPLFTRQFLEAPGPLPYHCTPHCPLGMRGTVTVTAPIDLQLNDSAGSLQLNWSGGGGSFAVFHSALPSFADGLPPLPPDAGDAGTAFTDTAQPAAGSATFYLVMNKQP